MVLEPDNLTTGPPCLGSEQGRVKHEAIRAGTGGPAARLPGQREIVQ